MPHGITYTNMLVYLLFIQIRSVGEDSLALSPWSSPIILNVTDMETPQTSTMTTITEHDTEFYFTGSTQKYVDPWNKVNFYHYCMLVKS